jgi:hypothetical protein
MDWIGWSARPHDLTRTLRLILRLAATEHWTVPFILRLTNAEHLFVISPPYDLELCVARTVCLILRLPAAEHWTVRLIPRLAAAKHFFVNSPLPY